MYPNSGTCVIETKSIKKKKKSHGSLEALDILKQSKNYETKEPSVNTQGHTLDSSNFSHRNAGAV